MKALKKYILLIFIVPILASCTKVIDLDLGSESNRLVIEANITNISGPQTIKLSRNVPFTNTNVYPAVSGANVSVTDGTGTRYSFIESTTPGIYTNVMALVSAGKSYTMSVVSDSKTYTAKSTIPAVVALDSISTKNSIVNPSSGRKILTVHYQDPAGVANQYRFIIYINGVQVKTVYAYNDDFNDGRYVSLDLRVRDANDSDFGIYKGDNVTVEMQCIDKPVYLYWYSLQQQGSNNPGGSVTPADPPTNISPAALGYFSAHITQVRDIVVK